MVSRRRIHDQRRAEVKAELKHGTASLSQVIDQAQDDDAIGELRVAALLESLPGIGKVRSRQIMDGAGVAESGLAGELNIVQRAALEAGYRPFAAIADGHYAGPATPAEVYYNPEASPAALPQSDAAYGIEDWDRE